MNPDLLPARVLDELRFRRGKNREMAIEMAAALLPILRKHRRRFKSADVFAGTTTAAARACIDAVRTE